MSDIEVDTFGIIADLDYYPTHQIFLFWFKVDPLGFGCRDFIGCLVFDIP